MNPPPQGNAVMSLSIVRKIYLMKVAFGWEGNILPDSARVAQLATDLFYITE